jgi:hypothetical protein
VPGAAEQRHQRRGERGTQGGERAADRQRQPQRLCRELARVGLAAGAVQARNVGGRRVRQEVAQRDNGRQQRGGQRKRGELRRAEVPDDRRVGEQVERLGGERSERRQREAQDLAVMRRAAQQEPDSTIRP